MRSAWSGVAAVAVLATVAGAGPAGLGVGDRAPLPTARELVGFNSYAPRDLEGKVVFIEVFRTW
jgi:hypothetical protein